MQLSTAARNAAANAVVDLLDAGAAAGSIAILEGETILAVITLNDPAFGDASTGVCTLDVTGGLTATAEASGTADNWVAYDSDAQTVFSGTMAEMAITVDSVVSNVITSGQTVEIVAGTYTQPA